MNTRKTRFGWPFNPSCRGDATQCPPGKLLRAILAGWMIGLSGLGVTPAAESVRIFLDSSVLLSACGSGKSLSRLITELAPASGWRLVSARYCQAETGKNIKKLGDQAVLSWPGVESRIEWVPNALTSKKPLLLTAAKDKPVLISARAAKCGVLLTLDKGDFGIVLGTTVYGMLVSKPRDFLIGQGLG